MALFKLDRREPIGVSVAPIAGAMAEADGADSARRVTAWGQGAS